MTERECQYCGYTSYDETDFYDGACIMCDAIEDDED